MPKTFPLIKLAIVDDHSMFREGLKAIISGFEEIEVVAESENGQNFIDTCLDKEIDIALLDMDMPVMNGIDTLGKLSQLKSDIKVIISIKQQIGNIYCKCHGARCQRVFAQRGKLGRIKECNRLGV